MEYNRIINEYGNLTNEEWKDKFPKSYRDYRGITTIELSPEGRKVRAKVIDMKRQGKEAYIKEHVKNAEDHYKQSIEILGEKITMAGFDTSKIKLKSSSIGRNFETEVTDGEKYMRAYTIIAEGPIIAPHYRYLFTSQKK